MLRKDWLPMGLFNKIFGTYSERELKKITALVDSIEALSELRANSKEFATYDVLIRNHWKNHNTLLGFAMDHGCHEIDGGCGSHGLDMCEDLNIMHLYKAYGASEK